MKGIVAVVGVIGVWLSLMVVAALLTLAAVVGWILLILGIVGALVLVIALVAAAARTTTPASARRYVGYVHPMYQTPLVDTSQRYCPMAPGTGWQGPAGWAPAPQPASPVRTADTDPGRDAAPALVTAPVFIQRRQASKTSGLSGGHR